MRGRRFDRDDRWATPAANLGPATAPSRIIYDALLSRPANRLPAASGAVGVAVIALHRGSVLCSRFAQLHGFADATGASIHLGAKERLCRPIVRLSGPRLRHRGCVRINGALPDALQRNPTRLGRYCRQSAVPDRSCQCAALT